MRDTEHLNAGKTYKMKSIYEQWPETIDVQFRLTYNKGSPPIKGTCSSSTEPGTQPSQPSDHPKSKKYQLRVCGRYIAIIQIIKCYVSLE
jgi:hypothetical protein